ncbi:MAG: glycosyltransferase [Rudaea sp.]|nr:glycosyltransferase [Rudaea sp.]
MSRILLATFGSLGDLHPYLAVGRALHARGHQARIAASPDYQDAIEAAGLEFAPMRPRIDALGPRAEIARRLFHPLRGTQRLLHDIVMPHLRDAHADLSRAATDADLLVSHPLTYTLPIVAQQQSKPWLSSVLAPMSFLSRHDPPAVAGFDVLRLARRFGPAVYELAFGLARRAVRQWEAPLHVYRRELGLPPTRQVMTFEGQFSPHGTLALFDALLARPQADWPAHTQLCGAALYDGVTDDSTQTDELRRFIDDGEPPLVFALGSSAVWIAGNYWLHAVEASRQLKRRAVLLTGQNNLPRLPPGIRAFEYLPYSLVFPHAAVVVHQAGIGTLSQALRSGRPQLITPLAFDQPDNAARGARLGVGRVLPFARANTARLRIELQRVLADPCHAEAAGSVAVRLKQSDGAGAAADRIIAALG